MSTLEKIPPHHVPSELGAIGSVMLDAAALDGVIQILPTAAPFYDDGCRVVYQAIIELVAADKPVDGISIAAHLKNKGLFDHVGGNDGLARMFNSVPSSAHASHYAATVREMYKRRQLITAGSEIVRNAFDADGPASDVIDGAQQALSKIDDDKLAELGATAGEVVPHVIDNLLTPPQIRLGGMSTGFDPLDALTGGIHKKSMWGLAAHAKAGKTALALNIAAELAIRQSVPVAYFTFEMTREEIVERLLVSQAQVNRKALQNKPTPQQRADFAAAMEAVKAAPIIIDDECDNRISAIKSRCRTYQRRYGIQFVVIDYYQLMQGENSRDQRYAQLVEISRNAKRLASDLDVAVLMLAQLNADAEREDRLPRPNDIEECKKLGKDANVLLLLDREYARKKNDFAWAHENSYKRNHATLEVAAIRNGETGIIPLEYRGDLTRFYEPAHTPDDASIFDGVTHE